MGAKGRLFLSSGLLLTIGACATTQQPAKLVDIRPVKAGVSPAAKPSDPLYQAAVSAIERRDYALALDALQAARARSPDDPRVWNAMGVVYDKLGRFDLSARYYAQAKELDPASSVVAQNQAYSALLQGKQAEPRALAAAPAVPDPQSPQADAAVLEARLETPAPATTARSEPIDAPPPPVVARVTSEPAATRTVAQVPEHDRAPRLAAAGALSRWTAPAMDAFTSPAAPSAAQPAAAPAPTLAKVTRPAEPAQTVARPPASPGRALTLARVTEPLARFAAPVIEAFSPAPPPPSAPQPKATPAPPAVRAEPVRTMTLTASPAVFPAPPPGAKAVVVAAAAAPSSRPATAPAAPRATVTPLRIATPSARVTLARAAPANSLLGRPLLVVNASGRRRGAEPVRLTLASRGWTAPVSVVRPGNLRATSTIRYASRNVVVARALARTLPYRVRLESCGTSCRGVILFVGVDALRWTGGRARTPINRGRA